MRSLCWLMLIGILSPALVAKKRAPTMYVKPDQVAEIAGADQRFASADKPCANYAWAAAVNSVLAADDVRLPQSYWAVRASGGDRCLDAIEQPEAFTRRIDGEYTLPTGRRIVLRSSFQPGPPQTIDDLVVGLRAGRTAMIVMSGHVYLLQGIFYDDHLRSYNDHFFIVKEIRLIDPAFAPGAAGRAITFVREKDDSNLSAIQGVITLEVKDLKIGELSDGYQK